jgi:pimeloyl-ACP methyl ester carboxylesterase
VNRAGREALRGETVGPIGELESEAGEIPAEEKQMNKSARKVRGGAIAILGAAAVAMIALTAGDARAQTPNGWGWPTAIENYLFTPGGAGTTGSRSGAGIRNAKGGPAQAVIMAAPNPLTPADLNAVLSAARDEIASGPDRRRRGRLPRFWIPPGCDDPKASAGGKALAPHPMLTLGRPISGVGADGMPDSLIVVWDSEIEVGDEFTIALRNDEGEPSESVNEDGGLGQLGDSTFTLNSVDVTAIDTDEGVFAIAQYQAPIDFVRPSDSSNPNAVDDPGDTSRYVTFTFEDDTNDLDDGYLDFTILRPPVVLVHGLWGAPSNWDTFTPFQGDPRWQITEADYSNYIGTQISAFYPIDTSSPSITLSLIAAVVAKTKANAVGWEYNSPAVLNQIGAAISSFQNGGNPLGISAAAIQADLVVHSMGGDVSRYLPLLPNFYTGENFGQGSVHKVVTIDTPHLGSPLAYGMIQPDNTCLADLFTFAGNQPFQFVYTGGNVVNGAIGDLAVNPADGSLSTGLQTIHQGSTPRLPTAMIAGSIGPAQLDPLDSPPAATKVMKAVCGTAGRDPLALSLTSTLWPTVFNIAGVSGNDSDAIVGLNSEFDGLSGSAISGMPSPVAAVHSAGVELLGFGGPDVLDGASGVPDLVIQLLNTPVTNTSTFMTTLP